MGKLYPPIIESILPACYKADNGMVKITIPFSMNRSVTASQVSGFELKIKTVQTGTFLYTFATTNPSNFTIDENKSQVTFYIQDKDNKLKVGQFYKIQLAYISLDVEIKNKYYSQYIRNEITLNEYEQLISKEGLVGYYSTVGTIKYTTKPKIYINDFTSNHLNDYSHNYTGYYDQTDGDTTEKVYSYCFNIYDKDNNVILTSGECIHNNSTDSNPEISVDNFTVLWDLQYYEIYYIEYKITSINNIVLSSPKYRIMQRETISPEIYGATLEAKLNFDNGYIDCSLVMDESNTYRTTGSFILSRADEDSVFTNWVALKTFKLYQDKPEGFIFRDYTFEQGKKYQYSIQQYNDDGLYSKRIYSNIIRGDFEDAFLYDGERQLKLRYNTKMNKFSKVIQEAKQETIGSKYPFIFRNGNVDYHEFSIGGLISYTADEARLFVDEEKLNLNYNTYRIETNSQVTDFKDSLGEEITRERIFKNEVLDWLNNGKAKLFRSAEEGNYIIRIMKISLKPETKLGRMLHDFSGTAYEIAEYNTENLFKFNFANNDEIDKYITQWRSIQLEGKSPNEIINLSRAEGSLITSLHFDNMQNGDQIQLTYNNRDQQIIQIGATGTYYLDNINLNIDAITILPRYRIATKVSYDDFKENNCYYILRPDGTYYKPLLEEYNSNQVYYTISNIPLYKNSLITYSYLFKQTNQFSSIKNIKYGDPSFKQFIGEHDIIKELNNVKQELTQIYSISVSKRPVDKVVVNELNEENLSDSGQYYYGTVNENNQLHSERFPLIEMKYPVGLRVYEPAKYYTINKNDYNQDPKKLKATPIKETDINGEWSPDKVYYLKGRYVAKQYPIGLRALEEQVYYIEDSSKEEGYRIATPSDWNFNTTYYVRNMTLKGNIYYTATSYMTKYSADVFEPNKFYRRVMHQEKIKDEYGNPNFNTFYAYTPYMVFNTNVYDNYRTQSFELDENYNEYVEAYVTLNESYIYKPYEFYINIVNLNDDNSNNYKLSTNIEFNTNTFKIDSTIEGVECEGTILKYYKMKTIFPHVLHEIGTEWQEVLTDNKYKVHKLNTKKYIDFYNSKKNYLEYAPYIEINGERIYVDNTINFSTKQLNQLGNITELKSGNGVIVDIVYQTREYIYNIEDELSEKALYLKNESTLEASLDRLLLAPSDENYVNLMDESNNDYIFYYNNNYAQSLYSSYKSLISALEERGVI